MLLIGYPPSSLRFIGALADPKLEARFAESGATTLPGSTSDFAKLVVNETAKWAKVIMFLRCQSGLNL
jgi:hypothetical protein